MLKVGDRVSSIEGSNGTVVAITEKQDNNVAVKWDDDVLTVESDFCLETAPQIPTKLKTEDIIDRDVVNMVLMVIDQLNKLTDFVEYVHEQLKGAKG